jgi:aldose 1-epimerase
MKEKESEKSSMTATTTDFGNGYSLITLRNQNGLSISVTDFGARITSVKKGDQELIIGFDSAQEYDSLVGDAIYYGATVGRMAGRIAGGHAEIAGRDFAFKANEAGVNTLHGGGADGLHDRKWDFVVEEGQVIFTTRMADGLHGFPGNVDVTVTYFLTEDDQWGYDIKATTDQTTLWNPCNHVYYNLTGDASQTLDEHQLWLNASQYEPLSMGLPSLEKAPVEGTPFDFTSPTRLGEALHSETPQIANYNGIDHPFFLDGDGDSLVQVTLTSPDGKVHVDMATNQPSVVIFTANFGDNTPVVRGKKLAHQGALTFETQVAPGAERQPEFGNITLEPGQTYHNHTTFTIY